MTNNKLQINFKVKNPNAPSLSIKKFGIDLKLEIRNWKFKKISTILIISLFFIGFIGVGRVQSARLVPGNLPTTTPLQPMPINTYPNYSGNINSKQEESPEAEDVSVSAQLKLNGQADSNEVVNNNANITSNWGTLAFALILILAVILGYVYYKKGLRGLWK